MEKRKSMNNEKETRKIRKNIKEKNKNRRMKENKDKNNNNNNNWTMNTLGQFILWPLGTFL